MASRRISVGLLRVHPDEDLRDLGLAQVLDDVGSIVGVHAGEERRRLLARERPQDRGRLVRIELLEDSRDLLVRQPLEQDGDLARVETRDEGGPLGRPDPFSEAATPSRSRSRISSWISSSRASVAAVGHGTALDGGRRSVAGRVFGCGDPEAVALDGTVGRADAS